MEAEKTHFNLDGQQLISAGLNVIPVRDKRPLIQWEMFQQAKSDLSDVKQWQETFPDSQLGIVTGPISGILVLDIDGELGRESIAKITDTLPDTWTTKTRKGWHYYFKYEARFEAFPTTKVGILPGVDLRGRGGYVVAYDFIKGHSPADIELASAPQWFIDLVIGANKETETKAYKPGWISEALDVVDVGQRTQTFARIIGKLNRDGWAAEDIFALLKPQAEGANFDLKKLYDQIDDMTARYADQSKVKDYQGKSAATLLGEKSPVITWTIDQILPKRGLGLIAGWPGIGKSWFLLDMAICVATGQPWLGKFETLKGSVMYVDEDSDEDLVRFRLNKLLNAREMKKEIDINFFIREGLDVTNEKDYADLCTKIEATHPSLIIMDTLSDIHSEEENSTKGMIKVFKLVKRLATKYNCAFLFADHPRRSNGMDEGAEARLRGAVTKAGKLDSAFFVSRIGDSLLLEDIKARWGKAIKSFELRVVDTGTDATSVRYIG